MDTSTLDREDRWAVPPPPVGVDLDDADLLSTHANSPAHPRMAPEFEFGPAFPPSNLGFFLPEDDPPMLRPPTPAQQQPQLPPPPAPQQAPQAQRRKRERSSGLSPGQPSKKPASSRSSQNSGSSGEENNALDQKRQARLLRNRLSAAASRDRKKRYVSTLEAQVEQLSAQNHKLELQLTQMQAAVSALQNENEALRMQQQLQQQLQHQLQQPPQIQMQQPPQPSPVSLDDAGLEHDGALFMSLGEGDDNSCAGSVSSSSSPSPPSLDRPRAGLVLFALVFSFGVLYTMSGVELESGQRAVSVSMPLEFRGRVLQSLEEVEGEEGDVDVTAKGEEDISKAIVAKSTASNAVALVRPGNLKQLAQRLQLQILTQGQGDHALLTTSLSAEEDGDGEGESKSQPMDVFDSNRLFIEDQLSKALEMYRILRERGDEAAVNATSLMFCPSAIHIQPSEQQQTRDGPMQRMRSLASSSSSGNSTTEQMLLWVPSSSIAASWPDQHSHSVSQLSVEVRGVDALA